MSPSSEPSSGLIQHSSFRVSIASCIEIDLNCLSQNIHSTFHLQAKIIRAISKELRLKVIQCFSILSKGYTSAKFVLLLQAILVAPSSSQIQAA